MAYYIYSTEGLPNEKLMTPSGRGYTPEYIRWAGMTLVVPEKKWQKLPDEFTTVIHRDWRDKQGMELQIPVKKFKGIIDGQYAERGVIFLDHEPTEVEKRKLEALSDELNRKWRAKAIEWYEAQRQEKMSGNPGRLWPTAYEQECYEVLGVEKPYSVEAFKALREPGNQAAKQIAEAIVGAQKELIDAVTKSMDRQTKDSEKPSNHPASK